MRLIDDLTSVQVEQPTIVTIGAFDGLHIGHQQIMRQLVAQARESGRLSAVVTFYPHPRAVLQPWLSPKVLTTPGEKAVLLSQLGIDILVILRFTPALAQTPAPAFVRMLHERLQMTELWLGQDFALGRKREGDAPSLQAMGARMGFQVRVIDPVVVDGRPVSSTWVRELLATGQVDKARHLLGRPYSLTGEVVGGARRGRCLGFPTANLAVRPERALPPDGVYAVYALIDQQRLPAVANIGERPSFNTGQRTIEVHILDYAGNLYGRDLVIEFISRLRPERRFDDVQDLVAQIASDVEQARRILVAEQEKTPEHNGQRIS
jgi:riboflavin kinase/FMN adenylyltransferase